jgi:hypothetical protein
VAAFTDLDWTRFDTHAIVSFGGLATVDEARHPACRRWLAAQGYGIDTVDCRPGLSAVVPELGRLFAWEQQFGYVLGPGGVNLDALNDGFWFDIPEGGGRVFELIRPDIACQEDPRWLCGLLSIAASHSRHQLALGRRFFTLLVVPEGSTLIGAVVDQLTVPGPFWSRCRAVHEFDQ